MIKVKYKIRDLNAALSQEEQVWLNQLLDKVMEAKRTRRAAEREQARDERTYKARKLNLEPIDWKTNDRIAREAKTKRAEIRRINDKLKQAIITSNGINDLAMEIGKWYPVDDILKSVTKRKGENK
jgi:hypothetical protein